MPKIPTVKRNDSRLYLWDGGEHPGVTSVVGMLPKPALQHWAAKKVAECAVEVDLGRVISENGEDRAVDWLKRAPQRDLHKAADTGTNVHSHVEQLALGNKVDIPESEQGFVDGFNEFVDRFEPEWLRLEETVYGESPSGNGYAGSFDAHLKIKGGWGLSDDGANETWLVDFKTTRSGVHPEVAIQLAAYANAKEFIHPDGSTEPMDKIDRFGVLWLRPNEWSFVELNVTQSPNDLFFKTFCSLLDVWHFDTHLRRTALGAPLGGSSAERRRKLARPF